MMLVLLNISKRNLKQSAEGALQALEHLAHHSETAHPATGSGRK